MKRTAIVLATVGAVGLGAVAVPAPAEARYYRGFGPALAGGLIAGAIFGGLASSAYAYGGGYPYYGYGGYPYSGYYGGYAPSYYGGYAPTYSYGYGYNTPYRWGGYRTTAYYSGYAPAYYGYRYRHVVRPAFAYYRGPYRGWHHRHW